MIRILAGIHEIINLNDRFPNTYYKWQSSRHVSSRNGWQGPNREWFIEATKKALNNPLVLKSGKGGTSL
jgi:hypothetical protein